MDDVSWQPLARSYARELLAGHALFLLVAATAALVAYSRGTNELRALILWPGVIAAALYLPAAAVWVRIAVRRKGYALREHDILYHTGVLWQRVTAIPFNRVQHVETTSGILERLFGLASLVVFTAGGSGGDLRIRGLEACAADRLRDYILGRAGSSDEAG